MKNVYGVFLIVLMTSELSAQAPAKMSYQSVIRDSNNELVTNKPVAMRISILQGGPSGDVEFVEIHHVTSNFNGLISLEIGSGMAISGDLNSIGWSNGPYFLKTETDPDGGSNYTIEGVSQLLSVPYAMYAETGGEWKRFNDGISYDSGSVQIGTSNGAPFNSKPTLNIFGDSDPRNFILRLEQGAEGITKGVFISSPVSTSSARLFMDSNIFSIGRANSEANHSMLNFNINGNIGINEKNPRAKLHVKEGDIYINEIGKGVIMKSPNGQCWRMTVDNSGNPVYNSIECP